MTRSEDWRYITSIATHPRVWARIASDGLQPEDYTPTIHPRVHYLTAPGVRGWFSWRPLSTICYEGHIAVLEGDAERFARDACAWMREHGARKLAALIPAHNWHAKALALRVGFRSEGTLTDAVQWRGRLHDLLVLGMS